MEKLYNNIHQNWPQSETENLDTVAEAAVSPAGRAGTTSVLQTLRATTDEMTTINWVG